MRTYTLIYKRYILSGFLYNDQISFIWSFVIYYCDCLFETTFFLLSCCSYLLSPLSQLWQALMIVKWMRNCNNLCNQNHFDITWRKGNKILFANMNYQELFEELRVDDSIFHSYETRQRRCLRKVCRGHIIAVAVLIRIFALSKHWLWLHTADKL